MCVTRKWDGVHLLQLFANHHVKMEVTAYLSMFASAHKTSEALSVSMVSQYVKLHCWYEVFIFIRG